MHFLIYRPNLYIFLPTQRVGSHHGEASKAELIYMKTV